MPNLVERARQVIAAESDDYFQAEVIQYYINKGQRKVLSYMINQEREADRSLRALDNLKSVASPSLSAGSSKDTYFTVDEAFPADLYQFENLVYDGSTIMRELPARKLYMLEWGNLTPTQYEGYFYITDAGSGSVFRLFVHEDPSGNTLDIYYIAEPTDIAIDDDAFAELPDQLVNAVIYSAASMMATQEMNEATQLFSNMYQEEVQANVF